MCKIRDFSGFKKCTDMSTLGRNLVFHILYGTETGKTHDVHEEVRRHTQSVNRTPKVKSRRYEIHDNRGEYG